MKGVLWIRAITGETPADARATVDLEFRSAGGIDIFERNRTFPKKAVFVRMHIDAGRRVYEISDFGRHADRGHIHQRVLEIRQRALSRTRGGDISQVHPIFENLPIDRADRK